jgi:hypothetical protein
MPHAGSMYQLPWDMLTFLLLAAPCRYVAICPPDWPHGATVADTQGGLPRHDKPLQWDKKLGYRVRK